MRYVYTFWLWFQNIFLKGISLFASLLYYFAFVFVSVRALLFGAYAVVPIVRPFFRNNPVFEFLIGRKLMEHIDENDMTLRGVFRFFLLPYSCYLFGAMAIRWLVAKMLGG